MIDLPKPEYCLEINFQKGSEDPARVFRTMQGLIDSFHAFDQTLIHSIDSNIKPALMLEDIEAGSIKTWLSNVLEAVDDDALKNLDWKPAVGKYLVKAKYALIDFCKDKTEISDVAEIKPLEEHIHELATQTDVKWLPVYEQISPFNLLHGLEGISSSLSHLKENDSAYYLTGTGKVGFNLDFAISPESIEELLTIDEKKTRTEMTLQVKKPDYLGESKWDFRHGISARIADEKWLKNFQNRKIDVRPGDALLAIVEITEKFDFNGEAIRTDYNVLEVRKVMDKPPNPEQMSLLKE